MRFLFRSPALLLLVLMAASLHAESGSIPPVPAIDGSGEFVHDLAGVLYIHDASSQAIVGDTLFAGSIGRFDFPTSSHEDMRHTIMTTMMDLPDDLAIFPGHGPRSLIGTERETNPFILGGF